MKLAFAGAIGAICLIAMSVGNVCERNRRTIYRPFSSYGQHTVYSHDDLSKPVLYSGPMLVVSIVGREFVRLFQFCTADADSSDSREDGFQLSHLFLFT